MKEVTAYTHTHWDREWYREFEEFRLRLTEVVDRLLDDLKTGKLKSFYFDGQTAAIEDYLEIFPEKLPLIKKLINEKKLFLGPFYCLSDVFLVSSEFLMRNLEIGMAKSKALGCADFIAYLADTFGHSKGLVPILNYFGIDKVVMWRGLPDMPSEFMWHKLKAVNLQRGYFQNIFSDENLPSTKKAEFLQKELNLIAQNSSNAILLPIGGDHLASPKNLEAQIAEVNKLLNGYKIHQGTLFEYFEKVKNNHKKKFECEFLDNSKTFLLKGVYSSRIYLKQRNAHSQWILSRIAEPLQAFFHDLGLTPNYQKQLDYAYKTLIKNHAHDGIYGCSTDKVHEEMLTRFDKTDEIANGVTDRILTKLSDEKGKYSVVNLSNYDYSGVVKILSGKKIKDAQLVGKRRAFPNKKLYNIDDVPITEDIMTLYEYLKEVKDVPAFSVRTLSESANNAKSTLTVTEKSISNSNIELSVKNGKIEVFDKVKNKKYKNFFELTDRADIGDSYNFGALKGDKPINAKLTETKILQKGDIQSILRLVYEIKIPKTSNPKGRSSKTLQHKIFVDVILQNLSDYLEFSLHWENHAKNHILQACFNLEERIEKVISEDTQGVIVREFSPDYDIYKEIPAERGKELKTNSAPFQGFAGANGFCAATKGLQEYETEKDIFKLTILRSTGLISTPKNPSRGTPAGPPIEVEGLQCLGSASANFAIFFTDDIDKMYSNKEKFYTPVVCIERELSKNLLENKQTKDLLIQAVRLDEAGKLFVRSANKKTNKIINVK